MISQRCSIVLYRFRVTNTNRIARMSHLRAEIACITLYVLLSQASITWQHLGLVHICGVCNNFERYFDVCSTSCHLCAFQGVHLLQKAEPKRKNCQLLNERNEMYFDSDRNPYLLNE